MTNPDFRIVPSMRSIELLLTEIVDYAGLFPPAELEMAPAVARYADYRSGADAWMLGRFICPAARLDEFERVARAFLSYDADAIPWKVSALAGADVAADLARINDFNRRHTVDADEGRVFIDTIELKASSADEIARLMQTMHPTLSVYIEVPLDKNLDELLEAIAFEGVRAKVRSGGIVPEAFPSSGRLVEFMSACARLKVPFKATAGLHHPLRSVQRLTYEPDSPFGVMHGFLNLFLAAAWLTYGMPAGDAVELLEETSPKNIVFDETSVSWRGYRLSNEQIASSRRGFAIAFGSCSFAEPLEDLRSLGLR